MLFSLKYCNANTITANSIGHIDVFPNYFVINATFSEHKINWKVDENSYIIIFNNDKHQRISKSISPDDEAHGIKIQRDQEVDNIVEKKKSSSQSLTVNCTSSCMDSHWIITFKNDIDF